MRARVLLRAAALAPAFLLAASPPALAHMPAGANAFYGGVVHAVSGIEQILLLAAFGLFIGLMEEERLFRHFGAFMAGIVLGGIAGLFLGGADGMAPFLAANLAVLGGLVALGGLPDDIADRRAALGLSALFGLAMGSANVVPLPAGWSPILYFGGVLIIGAFAVNLVAQLTARARTGWRRIGIRVLGSWVAAVGVIQAMLAALT
ncbi:MAG: HupE/UreJ family protein [Alphaproteobacteria bacterium]|nr:HupE/UreJ family protein [Alphaproteobacteria bacterium]